MKRNYSSALLPVTVLLVMVTAGAAAYSGYKYFQLRQQTNISRLLPKDDATWGLSQLNTEQLKFANALLLVGNQNNEETRKNLSFRLDILYSRVEVTTQVFDRLTRWVAKNQAGQSYPIAAVFRQNAPEDLSQIRSLFSDIDQKVQAYLKTGDIAMLADISGLMDRMLTLSLELTSQVNQAASQTAYNVRSNIFDQSNQLQIALLTTIFIFVLSSVVTLGLYINVRRAEKNSLQLVEKLRLASRAKTQFLSSMSHELRTPMNAILGFGQILKLNSEEPLSIKQQRYVDYILSSGQLLLELINDVLDLARIESGKLNISMTEVDLKEVFEECLFLVDAQAKERGLSIRNNLHEACYIKADATRIKQVMLNLLSNAIKYNREGGTVTLTMRHTSENMVRISVIDTGTGFPDDARLRLFEPFERLGMETSGIQGTGVGLTITRQLVEAMGGHIGCESEVGEGSEFWVELVVADGSVSYPS